MEVRPGEVQEPEGWQVGCEGGEVHECHQMTERWSVVVDEHRTSAKQNERDCPWRSGASLAIQEAKKGERVWRTSSR